MRRVPEAARTSEHATQQLRVRWRPVSVGIASGIALDSSAAITSVGAVDQLPWATTDAAAAPSDETQ
jgi:hypothetical protein